MSHPDRDQFNPSREQVNAKAQQMLGTERVLPLDTVSTEAHLQRIADKFQSNPNSMLCNYSNIMGGTPLLERRRAHIDARLMSEDDPLTPVRTSALEKLYRIGFGIVEGATTLHYIGQAEPSAVSQPVYESWLEHPQDERLAEMGIYLKSQGADLLARNLLEPECEGTLLNQGYTCEVNVRRVTGGDSYRLSAASDTDARSELVEGALAGLFLIRCHQVAQFEADLTPPQPPERPDQALPGYYLG